jgi:hypothetical protein
MERENSPPPVCVREGFDGSNTLFTPPQQKAAKAVEVPTRSNGSMAAPSPGGGDPGEGGSKHHFTRSAVNHQDLRVTSRLRRQLRTPRAPKAMAPTISSAAELGSGTGRWPMVGLAPGVLS